MDSDPPGSLPPPPADLPDWIQVAQVTAPHGLRGELKVALLTEWPERFQKGVPVRLFPAVEELPGVHVFRLLSWRGPYGVGRLSGVERREVAEKLRGCGLQVARESCPPLPPGRFYLFELVGMNVWETTGAYLGQLLEVLRGGANDVYRVVDPASRRELLVPALRQVVCQVDVPGRQMWVHLPAGLKMSNDRKRQLRSTRTTAAGVPIALEVPGDRGDDEDGGGGADPVHR